MRYHLHYNSLVCYLVKCINSQYYEAHVAHARIRDKPFQISLCEGKCCTVKYPDDSKKHAHRSKGSRCMRKERYGKPDQSVSPSLKHKRRKYKTARNRSFCMSVREPVMQ